MLVAKAVKRGGGKIECVYCIRVHGDTKNWQPAKFMALLSVINQTYLQYILQVNVFWS